MYKRKLRAYKALGYSNNIGGSVWESNPPCSLVASNTGFEVREEHQNPIHSHAVNEFIILDLL